MITTVDPIIIEVTSPEGGTLHTAGKYCYDDIAIVPKLQDKTITKNGTVSADDGYAGLGNVTVNVENTELKLQEKTVTANGEVTADEGYDGLSKVTVSVKSNGISAISSASGQVVEPTTATATSVATLPIITAITSAVGSIEE